MRTSQKIAVLLVLVFSTIVDLYITSTVENRFDQIKGQFEKMEETQRELVTQLESLYDPSKTEK